MDEKVVKIVLASVFALAGTGLVLWSLYKSSKSKSQKMKKRIQKKDISYLQNCTTWEKVGKLKCVMIYPIKSCAGISVQEAIAEKTCLRTAECRDRSLMVIDGNGDMMTARKFNNMVLLTSDYDQSNNSITLNFPHLQPIKIYLPLIEIEGNMVESKVWGERVTGFDCGDEAADWLNLALGCKCRLIYHGSLMSRRSTESLAKQHPLMNQDDNSLYADLTGFMLMAESSILDLEKRVSKKLPFQNFRPNMLVEGSTAYDEDDWTYIKIGETIFRNTNPCDRCSFPTIDYRTGVRDKNLEPLKTLRKYRCPNGANDPNFGINLGIDKTGRIKVGDEVFVLRT